MKHFSSFASLFSAILGFLVLAACVGGGTSPEPITPVKPSSSSLSPSSSSSVPEEPPVLTSDFALDDTDPTDVRLRGSATVVRDFLDSVVVTLDGNVKFERKWTAAEEVDHYELKDISVDLTQLACGSPQEAVLFVKTRSGLTDKKSETVDALPCQSSSSQIVVPPSSDSNMWRFESEKKYSLVAPDGIDLDEDDIEDLTVTWNEDDGNYEVNAAKDSIQTVAGLNKNLKEGDTKELSLSPPEELPTLFSLNTYVLIQSSQGKFYLVRSEGATRINPTDPMTITVWITTKE
jgi:hypothetical protein